MNIMEETNSEQDLNQVRKNMGVNEADTTLSPGAKKIADQLHGNYIKVRGINPESDLAKGTRIKARRDVQYFETFKADPHLPGLRTEKEEAVQQLDKPINHPVHGNIVHPKLKLVSNIERMKNQKN